MYIIALYQAIDPQCVYILYRMQGCSQPHRPRWARVPLSSFFLNHDQFLFFFHQTLLIFPLILALRLGESPTWEGPGYTTDRMHGTIACLIVLLC